MGITTKDNKLTATTFKEMLTVINDLYDTKIDVDSCNYSVGRIKIVGEGYIHSVNSVMGMFNILNNVGAKINTVKSRLNGSVWQLEFNTNVEELLTKTKQEVVGETTNEDIEKDKEEDLQESVDAGANEVKTEDQTQESEQVEVNSPDFDYAESLLTDDKAQSKKDLEEYARTFGVELARNKKFESMLQDFKDAV